jgi:hypothetical protein
MFARRRRAEGQPKVLASVVGGYDSPTFNGVTREQASAGGKV